MLCGTCLSHECVHPHIASHSDARSGRCIMRCTAHIDSDASASMLSSCNAMQHRIALPPPAVCATKVSMPRVACHVSMPHICTRVARPDSGREPAARQCVNALPQIGRPTPLAH